MDQMHSALSMHATCYGHIVVGYVFTMTEVLLQIVHDLCGITDDIVIVNEYWNFSRGVQTHEPRLIMFTQRQTHIIFPTLQAFLGYCQSHL